MGACSPPRRPCASVWACRAARSQPVGSAALQQAGSWACMPLTPSGTLAALLQNPERAAAKPHRAAAAEAHGGGLRCALAANQGQVGRRAGAAAVGRRACCGVRPRRGRCKLATRIFVFIFFHRRFDHIYGMYRTKAGKVGMRLARTAAAAAALAAPLLACLRRPASVATASRSSPLAFFFSSAQVRRMDVVICPPDEWPFAVVSPQPL